LPAILPKVKKLVTFIRGTSWISPVHGLDQHKYTETERQLFKNNPDGLLEYRKMNETSMNCLFGTFIKDSDTQNKVKDDLTAQMRAKLNNPELASKLIPKWSPGCRRLTPGINYLETLRKDNVEVVLGEINRITEGGCVDNDGVEYPLDVLICATGFDVSFKPRFPVQGPGINLQQEWADDPRSYLGTAAAGMPNYMFFLGPNCPIGNGPVLRVIGM
jgi:cation diffusion facilitator CzcD-associated flavoprotein CzcO